jgi:hypothetical protein
VEGGKEKPQITTQDEFFFSRRKDHIKSTCNLTMGGRFFPGGSAISGGIGGGKIRPHFIWTIFFKKKIKKKFNIFFFKNKTKLSISCF